MVMRPWLASSGDRYWYSASSVRRAFRHVEVEGVHVRPDRASIRPACRCRELQAGQLVDRAVRAVVGGQPLRIQQGQRARLDRDGHVHAEDLLRQVGRIDVQHDGAGVGLVDGRGHVGVGAEAASDGGKGEAAAAVAGKAGS